MQSRKRGAAHTAVEVDYVIEAINKITPETPAEDMYGLMAALKSELEAAKAGKAGKAELSREDANRTHGGSGGRAKRCEVKCVDWIERQPEPQSIY
jgi:hypothetical protein